MATPSIILYTNHGCPWAHRAHIALHTLALPFKEEIIDLTRPRDASYLAVNPRGLVPSLSYDGEIITESAIVAQFLVDKHPSSLLKKSDEQGGALQRARVGFFVDTFFTKVNPQLYPALRATAEEKEALVGKLVDAVVKEIEPLLVDANPFFGGASTITLAEVQTGSFILRILSFPKYEGLLPADTLTALETRAPNFWRWASAVIKDPSVTSIWDEKTVAERTQARLAK
ncbi:hypothetical protein B7494_g1647 [Chlorociboria aeruginascens]|nr:hypothetical protein B7494_g1647 [Chlorociboria aeruginascens]